MVCPCLFNFKRRARVPGATRRFEGQLLVIELLYAHYLGLRKA